MPLSERTVGGSVLTAQAGNLEITLDSRLPRITANASANPISSTFKYSPKLSKPSALTWFKPLHLPLLRYCDGPKCSLPCFLPFSMLERELRAGMVFVCLLVYSVLFNDIPST